MAETEQERTEQATPKRRKQARTEGRVVKSADLIAGGSLLCATLLIASTSRGGLEYYETLTQSQLAGGFTLQTDVASFSSELTRLFLGAFGRLALLILTLACSTLVANLLQSGLLFLPNKLAPDFSRVSPFKNFANIFSFGAFAHLGFSLFKGFFLLFVAFLFLRKNLETLVSLPNGTPMQCALFAATFMKKLALTLCACLLGLGAFDYVVKRFQFERSLRMTPEEIREELKEESGNPLAKGRILALRRTTLNATPPISQTQPSRPISLQRERQQSQSEKKRDA